MQVIPLQSGSNGNCLFVEAQGVRLLFDAGISGIQAQQRLAQFGHDIRCLDALLISHDHSDHIRSAGIYQRKFGLPLHLTEPTLEAAQRYPLGTLGEVRHFLSGQTLRFGPVRIETVPTPHDGVDGVAFVVDDGHCRLGILTDLGHVFDELRQVLATLDAVVLESNYDPQLLATGSYPEPLKRRIRGPRGHLSNQEAAELLWTCGPRLRWACLAHLSEENNRPALALTTCQRLLGTALPLHVASRYTASDPLEV